MDAEGNEEGRLWFCTDCTASNFTLGACAECGNDTLKKAIKNRDLKDLFTRFKDALIIGAGIGATGLFIFGIPLFFAYSSFLFGFSEKPSIEVNSEAPELDENQLKVKTAIQDFIKKNYLGWSKSGDTLNLSDIETETKMPFELHLTKEDENKVVNVLLERFEKDDGSNYWFIYGNTGTGTDK